MPAATAEPTTPATLGPMACISRKFEGSAFWPSVCDTRAAIGTAETPAETGEPAPEKPRESFFRRQRRELSDAWREIYCNSRVRRIRTWQIAVFALMIVEAAVMAIAVHPAYWVGAGLLALLCVRQLFDRRPERHSAAGVVLYGVIAVLIGIFVAEQVL